MIGPFHLVAVQRHPHPGKKRQDFDLPVAILHLTGGLVHDPQQLQVKLTHDEATHLRDELSRILGADTIRRSMT